MSAARYRWHVAIMLALAAAVNYADRAAISSVFPLLRTDLGLSDVALASLGSVFLWSYAVGSPLAGVLADRVSRSRMVVWSLAAWSLITVCTGMCANLGQLLTARALLGLAECAYLPAATALLADHHGTKTRATAMGIHSVGLNLGVVAGGTAAGYLGDHFGWRPGFCVLGGVGLLLALLLRFILRDASTSGLHLPHTAQPIWPGLKTLVRIPSYLALLAKALLAGVGVWIFFNWLPLFYSETFHMKLASAGFAGTFMLQAAATLGIGSGGLVSDRLAASSPRYRMLFLCISYFAAAPFLLVFLCRPHFTLVSVSISLFSLLRGLGQSNENPVLCDVVEPHLRSTAIGFMNTGASIAGGIGVLIAGMLKRDFGLAGVFGSVSGLFILAGTLLLLTYLFFLPRDLARQAELAKAAFGGSREPRHL